MKNIERVIAEGSGAGAFLASGCFGQVYHHGSNRVYKEAHYDGTGVWLERCFAIQKRLSLAHPLCAHMPEIFSFKRRGTDYEVVMAKYRRVWADDVTEEMGGEHPQYSSKMVRVAEAVLGEGCANDLHSGNILWCDKRGWIIVDPSSLSADAIVGKKRVDPKFAKAKRVVTGWQSLRKQ